MKIRRSGFQQMVVVYIPIFSGCVQRKRTTNFEVLNKALVKKSQISQNTNQSRKLPINIVVHGDLKPGDTTTQFFIFRPRMQPAFIALIYGIDRRIYRTCCDTGTKMRKNRSGPVLLHQNYVFYYAVLLMLYVFFFLFQNFMKYLLESDCSKFKREWCTVYCPYLSSVVTQVNIIYDYREK